MRIKIDSMISGTLKKAFIQSSDAVSVTSVTSVASEASPHLDDVVDVSERLLQADDVFRNLGPRADDGMKLQPDQSRVETSEKEIFG